MASGNWKLLRKKAFYELGQRRCCYCCVQLNFAPRLNGRACARNAATIDHVLTKTLHKGRANVNHIDNLVMACYACNTKRSDEDFRVFVTKNNFPRRDWLLSKYEKAFNRVFHSV